MTHHGILSRSPVLTLLTGLALAIAMACPQVSLAQPGSQERSDTILVSNRSHNDLVGIRVIQDGTISLSRLDLAPGNDEDLENPGGIAELRLDLGLSICSWKEVDLNAARVIMACPAHEGCIVVTDANDQSVHLSGDCKSLLPAPGDPPVCTLDSFRAGMTMRDACGLINTAYTADDSAYLTSLGFAGLVWSARLYAGMSEDVASARLEDIELRQVLDENSLHAVQTALDSQGYVPWQATLPGIEMNFTEMGDMDAVGQRELLTLAISSFLRGGRGEASILFAPAGMLGELTTGDAPSLDVQLFTVILRRDSDTLILDMASYSGDEPHD